MNTEELRKLAHLCLAADLESGQSPDTWHESDLLEEADGFCPEDAAFIAAASPAAVLSLLDRITELEVSNRACVEQVAEWGAKAGALQAEVDKLIADNLLLSEKLGQALGGNGPDSVRTRMYRGQRDEAREAVKRLAGALEKIDDNEYQFGQCWMAEKAREALADPVVRRIVEGE